MTDHNEILDEEIYVDAPIPTLLMARLRDNPIAALEGADRAARISPRAWNEPAAGDVAIIQQATALAGGIGTYASVGAIGGIQFGQGWGTVRFWGMSGKGSGGVGPTTTLRRQKRGQKAVSLDIIWTWSGTTGEWSVDIDYQPFDYIELHVDAGGANIQSTGLCIKTNGLIPPIQAFWGYVGANITSAPQYLAPRQVNS